AGFAERAPDDGGGVPAAEQDADGARRRQFPPEPPVPRPLALLVALVPERHRADAAGVQPFAQPVDHLALARRLHAGHDDDDRESGLAQSPLRLQQPRPQFRLGPGEFRLADLLSNFRRLKHLRILRIVPRDGRKCALVAHEAAALSTQALDPYQPAQRYNAFPSPFCQTMPLTPFHPAVAGWFERTFGAATDCQRRAWTADSMTCRRWCTSRRCGRSATTCSAISWRRSPASAMNCCTGGCRTSTSAPSCAPATRRPPAAR